MNLEKIDREDVKLKIILNDKKICHGVYISQITLLVILISSLSCFIIIASYSAMTAILHSDAKNLLDYLRLLSLVSSGYLGYVVLKLLQYLANTSTKYLIELNKFNSHIMKMK